MNAMSEENFIWHSEFHGQFRKVRQYSVGVGITVLGFLLQIGAIAHFIVGEKPGGLHGFVRMD